MEKDNIATARELINIGAACTTHSVVDNGKPYVALPPGYSVTDLERMLPRPISKRAKVVLSDHASFVEYIKAHGDSMRSVMYADVDFDKGQYTIVAVLDDNFIVPTGGACWREHTATLTPKLSHEWKTWFDGNKVRVNQSTFAAFIEDNMVDITSVDGSPTASDMLQMALAFESTSNKKFKRRIDLQSGGASFEYVDEQDETTSIKMKFFERFYIGIPVFQGENSAYPVEARLKYRQEDGRLSFWYELVRADRVFKQAIEDKIALIREATGFTFLYGKP